MALKARRAAMLEAEAFALKFGSRCGAVAHSLAGSPMAAGAEREHYQRVARIAEHRRDFYKGLDTATKYESTRWRCRHGSVIR